jgi:predicted TIM-barrel fold metal-dependent hydrolase
MAKHLDVLDRIFWGTDYPFADFGSDEAYWRAVPETCRRLGLEPEVTDADIDAVLGPNFAAYLAASPGVS